VLLVLSVACYTAHYLIFRDSHHIFIYLVGDIAFVFIEVFLVTIIIHRVLDEREKQQRLVKLNMVIGVFFSEVGTRLLRTMVTCDSAREELTKQMVIGNKGTDQLFGDTVKWLREYPFAVDRIKVDWDTLRKSLLCKRDFLLRLLENPNLLEHESFSELLQATFHLIEELESREEFGTLPDTDVTHLCGDLKRVYALLTMQWMYYMQHLKKEYPYLFSLAIRLNPFDEHASPIVK
jgi:hypothetical protein